jgi:hypothetical protein
LIALFCDNQFVRKVERITSPCVRCRQPGQLPSRQNAKPQFKTACLCPASWAALAIAAFLLGVIVIVGGLIYFPMLILGPIGERFVS